MGPFGGPSVRRPHAAVRGDGAGRRAVVVGAGLGADAEHLVQHGWRTVAFDVSPAAVRLARQRHPDSQVAYQVADLLALPPDLVGGSIPLLSRCSPCRPSRRSFAPWPSAGCSA